MSNSEVAVYDSEEPADIERKVYYLRLAGLRVEEIAQRENLRISEVTQYYNNYRLKIGKYALSRDREAEISLEADRLDYAQSLIMGRIEAGDMKAVDAFIKIINARIKLLGLDQLDPRTQTGIQNVLVLGEAKEEFLRALREGRRGVEASEKMNEEEAS
jgi:hypothetical protein